MSTSVLIRKTSTEQARVTRMADALSVPDGGFSISPTTGGDATGGYAVAIYPDREQRIGDRVSGEDVSRFVYANADILRRKGAVVGGWRDPSSGVAYLDVSVVVATRQEAERLARKHRQVAYFDLARGKSVAL